MHTEFKGPVVAFIDLLLTLAIIFLALSLPPKTQPPTPEKMGDKPICMMAIDIEWEGKLTSDVDLWVKEPGDEKSIGFSNAHGKFADLVRDDLGGLVDFTGSHSERLCMRAIPDGDYTVGIDLFRHDANDGFPIAVLFAINRIDPSTADMVEINKGSVVLNAAREEKTAVNFTIRNGVVLQESINVIPNPIKGYQ